MSTSEPFAAALLPTAMALNRRLRIEGVVSTLFHSNCRQIRELYHRWDHQLRAIDLDVATYAPSKPGSAAAGCFFTGGVDSFYSVLKNLEREHGDSRITHLIFIRGYSDCPLDNQALFEHLSDRLAAVAGGLSLRFLAAETNLRSFSPAPASSWDWYASSQLAAVGLCLGRGMRRLTIAGGDAYSSLSQWGSHPLIDPLWSTEWLEFRHDGCEAARWQKLAWYVARSRLALENLRVCGYESTGLRNCGTCEKCLRTMVGLTALGVKIPAGLFARSLDLGLIRRLNSADEITEYYLRDNLKLFEQGCRNRELEEAVRAALEPGLLRRITYRLEMAGREIDRCHWNGRLRSWALARAGPDAERHSALRASPSRWVLQEVLQLALTKARMYSASWRTSDENRRRELGRLGPPLSEAGRDDLSPNAVPHPVHRGDRERWEDNGQGIGRGHSVA